MSPTNDAVREVLRALAEARDGPFYSLWVDLTKKILKPLPKIGFRIYRVAETPEVLVVVSVSAVVSWGREVTWDVAVQTSSGNLEVTGEITVCDDAGSREILSLLDRSAEPSQIAELIQRFSREVCARRDFI